MENRREILLIVCGFLIPAIIICLVIFLHSEEYVFLKAKMKGEVTAYEEYLNQYPIGKKVDEACDSIVALCERNPNVEEVVEVYERSEFLVLENEISKILQNRSKKDFDALKNSNDEQKKLNYMRKYPREMVNEDMWDYLSETSAWTLAKERRTYGSYEKYMELFPDGKYCEEAAWAIARGQKTMQAYDAYIEKFPEGKYREEAIQAQVDCVSKSEHSELAEFYKISTNHQSESTASVHNSTGQYLTIIYTGPVVKRVAIESGKTKKISLPNGNYVITAFVTNPDVTPYVGHQDFNNGNYYLELVIDKPTFPLLRYLPRIIF